MIPLPEDEWRFAFSGWLRTGRLPEVRSAEETEHKYNPWHDPDDGRFTFAGAGVYYGRGGSGSGGQPKKPSQSARKRKPKGARSGHGDGSFGGAGASGTWEKVDPPKRSTGGSFGGGGASGSWKPGPQQKRPSEGNFGGRGGTGSWDPNVPRKPSSAGTFGGGGASGSWDAGASSERPSRGGSFGGGGATGSWTPEASPKPPSTSSASNERFRTVSSEGYTYEIDRQDRTMHVSGALTLAEAVRRSRTAQARAGGSDRRPSDDGGHYIAARFNGPTDAFNHFAQDSNFNRGGYRVLEDKWARALQAGKKVTVKITPYYRKNSARPYLIIVRFKIDGRERVRKFPNERLERSRGKR